MRLDTRALLILLCALAPAAAAANLVGNGSLEVVPNPGAGTQMIPAGGNALAPWTVTSGEVEAIGQFYWAPASGLTSLSLNGNSAGAIAQSFATTPGGTYEVSFSLSGDAFSATPIKHLRVQAAGATKDTTFDSTPAWHWDMAWTRVNWKFVANAAVTTLEFKSLDAGAEGPALDSVEVTLFSLVGAPPSSDAFALAGATPNPASGASRVAWSLPRAAHARLAAYDVRGREALVLEDGVFAAGPHSSRWDASRLAPGVYVLKLTADGDVRMCKLAVTR